MSDADRDVTITLRGMIPAREVERLAHQGSAGPFRVDLESMYLSEIVVHGPHEGRTVLGLARTENVQSVTIVAEHLDGDYGWGYRYMVGDTNEFVDAKLATAPDALTAGINALSGYAIKRML